MTVEQTSFFQSKLSPDVICSPGSLFAAGLPGIPRRIAAVAVPGCLVSLQFEHLVRLDEKCIIAIPHLCVDPHAHVRVEGKVSEVVGPLPLLAVPRAALPPAALEVRQVLVVGVAQARSVIRPPEITYAVMHFEVLVEKSAAFFSWIKHVSPAMV